MKQFWISCIAVASLAIAGGCGNKPEETVSSSGGVKSGDGAKKLRIAVIPKGSTHEFWKSVHAGASEAAAELGVEVMWKGPQKEDDRDDQIKVVEDFITQKADGIVLAPLDDTALRIPVQSAIDSGIPVLIIDSGLKDIDTVSFVATDNFKGGQMAGERMLEKLGPSGGKLIVLRYQEGSASTTERENGFLDAVKGKPGVEILVEDIYAGATTETAQKASENLLARFKEFGGVFCPNESSTFGMLRALQDSGMAGKRVFIGFDASTKLVDGLKAGEIDALVVQNPRKMGYLGVKHMVEHLNKKSVEKRVDTGAVLITKDNMAEPEVAKMLEAPK